MTTGRGSLMLLLAAGLLAGCASTAPPTPPAPAPAPPTTAQAGATTVVAVAPPAQQCCPHETLPEFLGIKHALQCLGGLIDRIRNRLGSVFPGLEATPPVLAITDPKNADSSNPAVKAAAAAKADEDQAAQKIKAIRYLATLGCAGCYPDVEDALLAALDDCTESVRYEAAKAFRELSGRPCSTCKTKSCCSPKVRKKLEEVANKMVDNCYKESSERVRRMARLALAGCGGGAPTTATAVPQEGPSEGPEPGAKGPKSAGEPTRADGAPVGMNDGGAPSAAPATASAEAPNAPTTKPAAVATALQILLPGGGGDCPECNQPTSITIPLIPTAQNMRPAAGAAPVAAAAKPVSVVTATGQRPVPLLAAPATEAPAAEVAAASSRREAPVAPAVHTAAVASGAILAEVNGQSVFESEVLPEADRQLSQAGPNLSVEDKLRMRPDYIRRELIRVIDRKLICQEAHRAGPAVAPAAFNPDEDEATVATSWLQSAVPVDANVSPAEMLDYDRANQAKYPRPAEVRYEQVTARVNKFASRDEALAAITYARNRALGAAATQPPANLAALEVQTFSWTSRDAVPSSEVAAVLFRLPVGMMSSLLDTGDAWRVVRVLERHAAGPAPFELVSELVRQQIVHERRAYLEEAYVRQLRGQARVWTTFDQPSQAQPSGVRPL